MLVSFVLNWSVRDANEDWGIEIFFYRATLDNKQFDSQIKSSFHVFMVFVYTFLTIAAVQSTRREAQRAYKKNLKEMSTAKDAEWLKSRTIHIKGIPAEDRTGNGLRQVLESFLEKKGGMVIAVQMIPPFHRIFEIETKMRDIKYLSMLYGQEHHFFCCAPTGLQHIEQIEEKLA